MTRILLSFLFVLITQSALARERFEFCSGSIVSLDFASPEVSGSSNFTLFNFFSKNIATTAPTAAWPKFGYFFSERIQANVSFGFNQSSQDTDPSVIHFLTGLNYGLEPEIQKTVFLELRAGLMKVKDLDYDGTTYLFEAAIGKRFQLFQNITLTPELSFKVRGPLDQGTRVVFAYSIIPVQMSLFF